MFLLNPFLGVVQAFKHFRQDWAKNSIWLFIIFYGFTMFRPEAMDSSRYVSRLQVLYEAPLSWDIFVANFYSEEGTAVDLYQPLVTYLLSFFTNSGNVLFAVFGITYGYFYSRNLWLLLDWAKNKRTDKTMWLLLVSFAFMIGFWELNGVRMWTAAHMFFYGSYLFIISKQKKGLVIAALTPLVHYSFMLPLGLLLFYTVVKIPWRILYFVFIASFFLSELNIASVGERLTAVAPEFLVPRINSYTSDKYIEALAEGPVANWYVTYYLKAVGWVVFIMISVIYFTSQEFIRKNKAFSNFFGFTMLFLTIGNVMAMIPSGGRYLTIARLFALALIFLFYMIYDSRVFARYLKFSTPLLLFFIIVSVRVSFETLTFVTILANPLIAAFIDMPIPLISLLK